METIPLLSLPRHIRYFTYQKMGLHNLTDMMTTCRPVHELIKKHLGALVGTERFESINRCVRSFVHACQCPDASCTRMSCHKLKRVVEHTKTCTDSKTASCPVCKQLMALVCFHAKNCEIGEEKCPVPFCKDIRKTLTKEDEATEENEKVTASS